MPVLCWTLSIISQCHDNPSPEDRSTANSQNGYIKYISDNALWYDESTFVTNF